MDRRKNLASFADYLRTELFKNQPKDWNINQFGKFPGTSYMFQRYFTHILTENKNTKKIACIEKRFRIKKDSDLVSKIKTIDGKSRSIEKFFTDKTIPHENNLNFIALVFDAPIHNFADFLKSQTKPSAQEKTELTKQSDKTQKTNNFKINNKVLLLAASVIVLLISIYPISILLDNKTTTNEKILQEHAGFFPQNLSLDFVENSYELTDNKRIRTNTDTVLMHTLTIYNDQAVYTQDNWSFATDAKGEDMNSGYGKPFNEDIISVKPMLKGTVTLARERMDIHFNIQNLYDTPLFFVGLKLNVDTTFSATVENAKYNLYKPFGRELFYNLKSA